MRSRLAAGAKVILYVNGKPYAPVVSFRWDSTTVPHPIMGLDSGEPYELAPATTKITGNLMILRQIGDGGIEGAGLVPNFGDLPRGKYFTLALVDRVTDTTMFQASKCWIVSQSWDVPSKGLVTGSVSFEAIDWNNEASSR
jgi:hypothetical protein